MSWEELLRQRNGREGDLPSQDEAPRNGGSLIQQAGEMAGQAAAAPLSQEEEAPREPVCLSDGYVRRSPVQPYLTAEDYGRHRVRRALMTVLGLIVAALVLLALIKSGFLVFRFR